MSYRVVTDGDEFKLTDGRGRVRQDAHKFLRGLEARLLSKHTIRAYAFDLLALFRWLKQTRLKLDKLTKTDLLQFVQQQKTLHQAARTINRRLSTVQLFYRFVTGQSLPHAQGMTQPGKYYRGRGKDRTLGLHRLPAPVSRRLSVKVPRTLVKPLTPSELRQLFAQFNRCRDLAILYLMLLCGLRSQEVLSLTCSDVLLREKTLRVHGKGNKERTLPLPDAIARIVQKYLAFERPRSCTAHELFVVLQGERRGLAMTATGLRSIFRVRRKKYQLQFANPHRLRHTFGANMAREGVTLPVLQRLMGHADGATTLQYVNLSMVDIAAEFERCAGRILAYSELPRVP